MNVLSGHEDLQAKEVLGFTPDGHVVVKMGDKTKRYKAFMMPGGGLVGVPVQAPPIDQLAPKAKTPLAQRHQGVDQHV